MDQTRTWMLMRRCAQVAGVQEGDALSVLAERFDCTVDQLREWNELPGDTIRIGQELVVSPQHASAATAARSPWPSQGSASPASLARNEKLP